MLERPERGTAAETETETTIRSLIWSDELSVGSEPLDRDHKSFFELCNLITHIDHNDTNIKLIMPSALTILEEYVCGHFFREEKAMKAAKFSDLQAHMLIHTIFHDRVISIIDSYSGGHLTDIDELAEMVCNWVQAHIQETDMAYKDAIANIYVDDRPIAFLTADPENRFYLFSP